MKDITEMYYGRVKISNITKKTNMKLHYLVSHQIRSIIVMIKEFIMLQRF